MPGAVLIVNLGAPFRIRAGTDIEAAEYADGVVLTTPPRALEFGYPPGTRSVGVHFKPWGLAPFLPMPAAELCDRPVTLEEVWGRPTVAELRDRLVTAAGPHEMLTLLEDQLMRLVCETAGLGLVRHTSSVIAAATGAVAIGDLSVAAGVSSTHLAQRFKGGRRRHAEAARPHVSLRRHRARDRPRRPGRLARARRSRRLLRPGPLRPRLPDVHGADADSVPRPPAAVPARTSRPSARRRTAASRLIFYKTCHSRDATMGASRAEERAHGQGGHIQHGVGGRLHRGRERPARPAV